MARIRTFKPEFLRHEELQELENRNQGKYPMFVFMGLWSACDKQGVFPWKPRLLKLDIYPFLDYDPEETLGILLESGLIEKFGTDDGRTWGFVPNFEKHQRIVGDEAKHPPRYPAPPSCADKKQPSISQEARPKHSSIGQENGKGVRNKEYGERNKESRGSSEPPSRPPLKKTDREADSPLLELSASEGEKLSPPARKKPPLREREPENDQERVFKAYLENWDRLYREGAVNTADPVMNYPQIGSLLKRLFTAQKLTPDQITAAIKNGLENDFVMKSGYSLAVMLKDSVLNGLLNSTGPPRGHGSPPGLAGRKSLGALTSLGGG